MPDGDKQASMKPVNWAYATWTLINLALFGLSLALYFQSRNQDITVKKDNLLTYYPGFLDATKNNYNTYTDAASFKQGDDFSLKTLADPGKCGEADADYCYKNKAGTANRMWYTYRFSAGYTTDNTAVGNISPMLIHNANKNASVSKYAWEDGIEGNRIYSPAECYELVRSYSHIFLAQVVLLSFFVGFHIFIFAAYGYGKIIDLKKVIPVVFDVSALFYTIGWFYFWYLIIESNENQPHCQYLSDWFGKGFNTMHSFVISTMIIYVLALVCALVTAYAFKAKTQGYESLFEGP